MADWTAGAASTGGTDPSTSIAATTKWSTVEIQA